MAEPTSIEAMDPSTCFATARLRMRPLDERDAALYCELYSTPGLMRNIAPARTPEAAARSFAAACRQQLPRPQRWIVSDRQSHLDVGLLGLVGRGDAPEIGVMLLGQSHGRGLGTEAMAGLADWAFTHWSLQRIAARQSVPDNPPVVRMMLRLGYTPLPATTERPEGGEWMLERSDWASHHTMAMAPSSR
jgi:RimJ/RimL family protein N-acetyltransferase